MCTYIYWSGKHAPNVTRCPGNHTDHVLRRSTHSPAR